MSNLYENKEDAEFVAKYHTSRVEKFEPPTWEELKQKKEYYIGFTTKKWTKCWLAIDMPYRNDFGEILITYADSENNYHIIYDERLTKENYYKAVEKARKLFLGESDESNND